MHTLNKASQLMPEVCLVFLSQFEDARGGDCILLLHLVHQGPQRKDTIKIKNKNDNNAFQLMMS